MFPCKYFLFLSIFFYFRKFCIQNVRTIMVTTLFTAFGKKVTEITIFEFFHIFLCEFFDNFVLFYKFYQYFIFYDFPPFLSFSKLSSPFHKFLFDKKCRISAFRCKSWKISDILRKFWLKIWLFFCVYITIFFHFFSLSMFFT